MVFNIIDLILLLDYTSFEHGIFAIILLNFSINKEVQTSAVISISRLLCELSIVSKISWKWIAILFVVFYIVFEL
jgi:hypothetical protein